MDARVALNLPELRPPSFKTERPGPGMIRLHYRSERLGLGPKDLGLVRGLAARFDPSVDIEMVASPESASEGPTLQHAILDVRIPAR